MANPEPTTEVAQRQLLELLAEIARDERADLGPYLDLQITISMAGHALGAPRAGQLWERVSWLLLAATREFVDARERG